MVKEALDELTAANGYGSVDYGSILNACYMLADAPAKDMKWSQALRCNDRDQIIDALVSEEKSLEASILQEQDADHPDFDEAVRDAISG